MCGEHLLPVECERLQGGSSPHVRGTLEILRGASKQGGIIPACAGNTCA